MRQEEIDNLSPFDCEVHAELCRKSFYYFLQLFWDVIIHEDPIWNWHLKYLCDELQGIAERVKDREENPNDYIINIPPGTTKSTIASVMYPAWTWTIDPTQRFICASYAKDLSMDLSKKSRDIIRSDLYKRIFPDIIIESDKDLITSFQNTYKGQRFTTATNATVTGMHGHQIIIDDPIDPRRAASEVEIKNANIWLKDTLSQRKVDRRITVTIMIMQRLHENDPTGYKLENMENIIHIKLPATSDGNVKPEKLKEKYINGHLDPIRLSAEILRKEKKNLGSYMYSAQFDQDPIPMEGNLIKKKWFKRFSHHGLLERAKDEQKDIVWDFIIDSAYTNNEDNAASAMLSYCKLFGNIYIRNITTEWLEFPELTKWIEEVAKNNGYDWRSSIRIEPKASGMSAAQSMNRSTTLNVMLAKSPVTDKVARAVSCTPTMEAGRVYLLEGGEWVESFLTQCSGFPNMKLKDQVDCLTMAIDEAVSSDDSVIIL